jgi:hypothetical protein
MRDHQYFRRKPIVVEGVLVTMDNGQEVADWCGGSWHPDGVVPEDSTDALVLPCVQMPPWSVGLPVAYALTNDYARDRVMMGPHGEFSVSRPDVFAAEHDLTLTLTRPNNCDQAMGVTLNAPAAHKARLLARTLNVRVPEVLRQGLSIVALAASLQEGEYLAVRRTSSELDRILPIVAQRT